jgi:hypothetical protein
MASRPTARYTSPARDDWEAQSALDTLMRAEQIEKDAKLMKRVRKLAAARLDELKKVQAEFDDDKD